MGSVTLRRNALDLDSELPRSSALCGERLAPFRRTAIREHQNVLAAREPEARRRLVSAEDIRERYLIVREAVTPQIRGVITDGVVVAPKGARGVPPTPQRFLGTFRSGGEALVRRVDAPCSCALSEPRLCRAIVAGTVRPRRREPKAALIELEIRDAHLGAARYRVDEPQDHRRCPLGVQPPHRRRNIAHDGDRPASRASRASAHAG